MRQPTVESRVRRGLTKQAAERRAQRIEAAAGAALDKALAGEKKDEDREALLRALIRAGAGRLRTAAGPLQTISLLGALCHEPLMLVANSARDAAEALFAIDGDA